MRRGRSTLRPYTSFVLFFILTIAPVLAETRQEVRDLYRAGVKALQAHDAIGAVAIFSRILASGHEFPEAANNLGVAERSRGDHEAGIRAFKRALALDPNHNDARNNLALAYAETGGDLREALALSRQAVASDPKNPAYHDTLGIVYGKNGLRDRAAAEFRAAIALEYRRPAPHYHLAEMYREDKKPDLAVAAYRDTLLANPDHLMSRYRLYRLALEKGELSVATDRLGSLVDTLGRPYQDRGERKTIEEELLCNLRTSLLEFDLALDRTEGGDRVLAKTSGSVHIDYEALRLSGRTVLERADDLCCPKTGRFFTDYTAHVVCPVHGTNPLFTATVLEVAETRRRDNARLCEAGRAMFGYARAARRFAHLTSGIEETTEATVAALIEEGFLKDIPNCPENGAFAVGPKGGPVCSIHPKKTPGTAE